MSHVKKISQIASYILQALIMFASYYLFSSFSLFATKTVEMPTSTFYLPVGIAISCLFIWGPRFLPIIFISKLATSLLGDYTLTRALITSLSSAAEAYVALYLYRSFKNSVEEFFPYQSTLILVTFIALVSAMVSALMGVTSLYYQGIISEQNYFTNFMNWYVGDILSILIFAPIAVSFKYEKHRMLDFIFPFLAVIFVSFFKYESLSPYIFLIFFLLLIPSCLGSIMGIYYTSIASVLVLNWFFINFMGPFSLGTSGENMVGIQLLIASIAFTAIALEGFRKMQLLKNLFLSLSLVWLLSGGVYYFYFNQKLSNDYLFYSKLKDDFELRMDDRMILIENALLGTSGYIGGSVNVDDSEWDSYIGSFFKTVKDKGVLGIGTSFIKNKRILFNSDSLSINEFKSLIDNEKFKSSFNSALIKSTPVLSPFVKINGKKISLLIKSISKNNQIIGWSIIPLDLESLFHSITDNRFLTLDIDIYETSELGKNNLIFSRVIDQKMRNMNHLDSSRLSTISLAERSFYIDWNNTFRFSTRNNTKSSLFLFFGSLFSLIITGSYLRLKSSLLFSRQNANIKNQELEESAMKYKILFDEEINPMILIEGDRIIDCNKHALKLFKRKSKVDFINLDINSLFDFHSVVGAGASSNHDTNMIKIMSEMGNETYQTFDAFILIYTMPFPSNIQISKILVENQTLYKIKIKELSHLTKRNGAMNQDYVEKTISLQGQSTQFIKFESSENDLLAIRKDSPTMVQSDQSDTKKTSEHPFFKGQKVLLVEDNQVNIIVTKKFLEKWGLSVEVALNGIEAIEMVKASSYQIILMDLHMPVMDGIEATKEIRKFNETVPIIGLSADVMSHGLNQFLAYGMNHFITKPFNPTSFRDVLIKFIN